MKAQKKAETRMRKRGCFLCLLLTLSAAVGGCAGGLTGESYVSPVLPEKTAVERMAADAVKKLASIYPPGHTAIELVRPQVKDSQGNTLPQRPMDAFSLALEDGLRKRGFSISPDATLRLAWTLDRLPRTKEEVADPLLDKAKEEDQSGQTASRTASLVKETKAEEMNWWLRLKLADIDRFEVFSLTRMYDGNGLPVAGFAEQVASDRKREEKR